MSLWLDYLTTVDQERKSFPQWRLGQTYFNVLHTLHPELANEIRGTALDPFHVRDRDMLNAFLGFVWDRLNMMEQQ